MENKFLAVELVELALLVPINNVVSDAQLYPLKDFTPTHTKIQNFKVKYGVSGFFRGHHEISPLIHLLTSKILKSPIGEKIKENFKQSSFSNLIKQNWKVVPFIVDTFLYPLQVIQIRSSFKSAENPGFLNFIETIKNSFHNNGIQSFFQGFGFQLIESLAYVATFSFVNKNIFPTEGNQSQWKHYFNSILSSSIARIVSYPFETLKKRSIMQYTVTDNHVVYEPETGHLFSGIGESLFGEMLSTTSEVFLRKTILIE
jgi:hypothetical protein